ncbi:MAG: YkgJ family cysteine cluster protein, partial [Thermoguttaceae bacterium]|nr:YkgJ family cysteine cluster protein [Thermoguttaceae bacterium]
GAPGYVWLSEDEIDRLADRFGLTKEDFEAKFVREIGSRKSLIEFINGDCVFYDRFHTNCNIYRDRPVQCRTWPFWGSNLKDEAAWENASRGCKGCNRGKLYTVEEIEARKNEREM